MIRKFLATSTVLGFLAFGGGAVAQDTMPGFTNSTFAVDMNYSTTLRNINDRAVGRRGSSGGQDGRAAAAAGATARTAAATTTYRSSPAVSRRVQTQFVDFMRQNVGEQGARELDATLSSGNAISSWSGIVRSDGLRSGDVVDAITAYWMLNWVIANQADNNRQQMQAVRNQVRSVVANSPTLAALSNDERQEMAEALVLNFLVQHAAYGNAMQAGDRTMMRRLGDAAVTRFRNEMGLDLRQLRLTDQGFVSG